MTINFISSKDTDNECVMKLKSDNIEFMIYDSPDEVIEELFESLLSRYRIWLETSMRGSDFVFGCVYLLYFKCRKINLGESYIDTRNG